MPAAAPHARLVVDAGGRADQAALAVLHRQGADLNGMYRGYRALHALIQEKPHGRGAAPDKVRVECLEWLLKHGADPELGAAWPPARAILVAAFAGEPVYVEALRKAGARVDFFVRCALRDLPAVEKALRKEPRLAMARDANQLTALHCCAASKLKGPFQEIAALLLDAGAGAAAKVKGWQHELDACYFACHSGQADTLDLLLERGADANSALTAAVWSGCETLGAICLRRGADPDRAVDSGKPLLNNLIRWGQIKPALWLLGKGAGANRTDEHGWTALHQAVSRGNERVVRALLAAGASRTQRDLDGFTPAALARALGREKIAALILG
jgi:ankyrin repeat protein